MTSPNRYAAIVPRHKQDFERANALASLPDQEVEPVIDDLIEWTFDSNWPIAVVVAKALLGRPLTLSSITTVLNGTDGTAKLASDQSDCASYGAIERRAASACF